jgi:hypothetical protein
MARVTTDLRGSSVRFFASTAALAAWRWRQQGWLLLVTGVGMIAAVILVCSPPLFSSVMLTAGLRSTLRVSPASALLTTSAQIDGLSTSAISQASRIVRAPFQQHLAPYMQSAWQTELATPDLTIENNTIYRMSLYRD